MYLVHEYVDLRAPSNRIPGHVEVMSVISSLHLDIFLQFSFLMYSTARSRLIVIFPFLSSFRMLERDLHLGIKGLLIMVVEVMSFLRFQYFDVLFTMIIKYF